MSAQTLRLSLNQQQLELLERCIARGDAADLQALARRALHEWKEGVPSARPPAAAGPDLSKLSDRRELLASLFIAPGTGKAPGTTPVSSMIRWSPSVVKLETPMDLTRPRFCSSIRAFQVSTYLSCCGCCQ